MHVSMLSSRSTYDLRQFTVDSLSAARQLLYSLLVLEYITNPFPSNSLRFSQYETERLQYVDLA